MKSPAHGNGTIGYKYNKGDSKTIGYKNMGGFNTTTSNSSRGIFINIGGYNTIKK